MSRTALRVRAVAIVLSLAGFAGACGSEIDHERLLEAARGPAPVSADRIAPAPLASDGSLAPAPAAGSAGGPATPAGGGGPAGAAGAPAPGDVSLPAASGVPDGEASCATRKSTITIGSVGQQSGVIGAITAPGTKAVQAWVAAVNAAGGVACHPVRYIALDDGGDPSRHQAQVRQLVEEEHAIALVFQDAPITGQATVDYLTQRRVPVIGSETAEEWFYSSPMYFPQGSSGSDIFAQTFTAVAEVAKPMGRTRLATVSCIETALCSGVYALAPESAPRAGLELVYRGQVSIAQPDYTSSCQAAKSAGAEILYVGLDSNSITRLARSCESVNYRPLYATTSIVGPQPGNPSFEGMVVNQSVVPWFTDGPGVQEYRAALKRYAPGVAIDSMTIHAWTAAKLFELAAANLPDDPTSADVLNGLWSIKDNDLNGLTSPLTFTRDQKSTRWTCFWITQITGDRYTSPNGGQRVCT
jgi:ABC-type branched-subunit amino acid transport system substrate-binding protein